MFMISTTAVELAC